MKKFPVVFDLETKHSFREEADPKKLGITVAALYDYSDHSKKIFVESEISKLFPILENASYIVGYNVKSFDIAVLQGYYPGNASVFHSFDILDYIREKIGFRLSLNDVVNATLGKRKSGHGLKAIELYKEGKIEELKSYCMDDVILTKELFEYGVKNKEIFYLNEVGKISIQVDWQKYLEGEKKSDMPLTLPF